jgi:GxxExxY protein
MTRMIHEELSRAVIGVAMEVLNELKPGLDEKLYERALVIELQQCGHRVEAQRVFPVLYHGEVIGSLTPDLIVDDAIIVDAKVRICIHRRPHRADGRVSGDYRARTGAAAKFQKCTARMEASSYGS